MFLGGFTVPALEAITGAPARACTDELLEAGLARRQSDDGRVELRVLVRAFALDALVARYAAGVAPETAGRWLAHAERINAAIDSELWPECVLREETVGVLRIEDLDQLLERTPPLDHAAALSEAIDWLAERDPAERSPREHPGRARPLRTGDPAGQVAAAG